MSDTIPMPLPGRWETWTPWDQLDSRDKETLRERLAYFLPFLTDDVRDRIVVLLLNTCPHCWSGYSTCRCWDDE